MKYQEWLLTVRSNTTHKTHSFKIRYFADQILSTVANEQAEKLGGTVDGLEFIADWQDINEAAK